MKTLVRRSSALLAAAGLVFSAAEAYSFRTPRDDPRDPAFADALFTNDVLLHLRIEIPEAGLASLRRDHRKYVKATVREGEMVYTDVAIHLKGSAGSLRGVDDKPGLTLSLMHFEANRKFHGLQKFHLNNSVQDPTCLSERICGDLFRAAGVPACRVAHALVELNGRKLELFVLKEAFNQDFLARYFKNTRGNMYGLPGGADITDPLERVEGDGPLDRADLKALAAAAQDPNPARRWERLQQKLDVDRFLSFMALEVIFCHWDGYTFGRHNYRAYHDLDTGRMVFFPHDLDQMMGDPNVPILPGANGVVADALLKIPEARSRYRERVGTLFTNLFVVPTLTNRINQLVARLAPQIRTYNTNWARDFQNHARSLKERIVNRGQNLEKQFYVPTPKTLKFESGIAQLSGWRKENERGGARLEQGKDPEGKKTLWIKATGETMSSWRTRLLLPPGRYRFEGMGRAAGINPLPNDRKGVGAGLRISGSQQPRSNKLSGDTGWEKLAYEFEATPNDEVELICELRANKGEVWFDLDSLRLVRQK